MLWRDLSPSYKSHNVVSDGMMKTAIQHICFCYKTLDGLLEMLRSSDIN